MISQGLAAAGAKVYIVGRHLDVLEKSCKLYSGSQGGKLLPLVGDVTKKESIKEMAEYIQKQEGKVRAAVGALAREERATRVSSSNSHPLSYLHSLRIIARHTLLKRRRQWSHPLRSRL